MRSPILNWFCQIWCMHVYIHVFIFALNSFAQNPFQSSRGIKAWSAWVSDHSFLQQCAVFMLVSVCMCTRVHVHNAWEPLTEVYVTCMHTMFTCIRQSSCRVHGSPEIIPMWGVSLKRFLIQQHTWKGSYIHAEWISIVTKVHVSVCVHVCALCLSYNCCVFACRRTVCLHATITCMHAECMMSPSKF